MVARDGRRPGRERWLLPMDPLIQTRSMMMIIIMPMMIMIIIMLIVVVLVVVVMMIIRTKVFWTANR